MSTGKMKPGAISSQASPILDPTAKNESISLTTAFSLRDFKGQDKFITDKAAEGWEFVESLMIYGYEVLMRFRRK